MRTIQQAKIQTLGVLVKWTFENLSRPKKVESKAVNAIVLRPKKGK